MKLLAKEIYFLLVVLLFLLLGNKISYAGNPKFNFLSTGLFATALSSFAVSHAAATKYIKKNEEINSLTMPLFSKQNSYFQAHKLLSADQTLTSVKKFPYKQLKFYFNNSLILPRLFLLNTPYVLAFANDRLVLDKNNNFYACCFQYESLIPNYHKNILQPHNLFKCQQPYSKKKLSFIEIGQRWQIVRVGDNYFDPNTKQTLGALAESVGEAVVVKKGDPVTLRLVQSTIELKGGDRLIPLNPQTYQTEIPIYSAPNTLEGKIIGVLGGVINVGTYQTVVLNIGKKNLIKPGALFTIYRPGSITKNHYAHTMMRIKNIPLPNQSIGKLLIYRVFENSSFGLVIKANFPIKISYLVRGTAREKLPVSFSYDNL